MPKTGKRAVASRAVEFAKAFHEDWEPLSRSGRYDMAQRKEAMLLLSHCQRGVTRSRMAGSCLEGGMVRHRQCHIGGAFLLIYKVDEKAGKSGTVYSVRAGTHSDLFKEGASTARHQLLIDLVRHAFMHR